VGLTGGCLDTEDLAVPVGVDPGGNEHGDVADPATLADLHRQRVRGHERVGAGVQRSGPEVRDVAVEVTGHHADLGA
jgi:hypothetical protein